jgi:hypothetical protein
MEKLPLIRKYAKIGSDKNHNKIFYNNNQVYFSSPESSCELFSDGFHQIPVKQVFDDFE